MMYQRDTLLNDLRQSVLEVRFVKTDGTLRTMRCTLLSQYLPENFNNAEEVDFHHSNQDVLAVWDIGSNGWRSFRIDSVQWAQLLDA